MLRRGKTNKTGQLILVSTGTSTGITSGSPFVTTSQGKVFCFHCHKAACEGLLPSGSRMSFIHYSFAPLILFRVPYMLDLLPYYLSIANGTGGIGIVELLVFQCFV